MNHPQFPPAVPTPTYGTPFPMAGDGRHAIGVGLDDLAGALERLVFGIEELQRRLAPVMRPVGPTTCAQDVKNPAPLASPLADCLRGKTDQVRDMAGQVADLIDRLEV